MSTGERGPIGDRGPTGDHGQAGADGREGDTGAPGVDGLTGDVGKTGPMGPPGSVLTKQQTLSGFLFVVIAFLVLAYQVQEHGGKIGEGVERQDQFLTELCQREPDLAPATCSIPR